MKLKDFVIESSLQCIQAALNQYRQEHNMSAISKLIEEVKLLENYLDSQVVQNQNNYERATPSAHQAS